MENENIGNVDLYYTYYNGTDEYSDFFNYIELLY